MRASLLLLFVFCAHHICIAQCEGLEGGFLFGAGSEVGHTISICQNGDYLLSGITGNYGPGMDDWLIIRTDQALQPIWTKAIGFANTNESGNDFLVKELSNGQLVATGYRVNGSSNGIVMLLSSLGDVIWSKSIQAITSHPREILETPEGGFVVCGSIKVSSGVSDDAMLIKFSLDGQVEWSKRFDGGFENDHFGSLTDVNNNIMVVGSTQISNGTRLGFLTEISYEGNIINQRVFQEDMIVAFKKIIESGDGSIIISGYQKVGSYTHGIILKLNTNFSIDWMVSIRQGQKTFIPYVAVDIGGNILAGLSNEYSGGLKNIGVASIDYNTGEIISISNPSALEGHTSLQTCNNFISTLDGGIISIGTKNDLLSVIAFNSCLELDCYDNNDLIEFDPDFQVINSNIPGIPFDLFASSSSTVIDVTNISLDSFCNSCSSTLFVEDNNGCEGEEINYFVEMSDLDPDEIANIAWNFGNGEYSSLLNPQIIYDEEGTWDFTVDIITDEGCEYNLEGSTEISSMPTPADIPSSITLCAGESYLLEFDQTLAWEEILDPQGNPVDEFLFTYSGTYTFSFNSPCNSITETIEIIQVNNSEVLGSIDSPLCIGTQLEIAINGWEDIADFASLDLDFGNGTSTVVDQSTFLIQYPEAGEYEVLLSGEIQGCELNESATVIVEAPLIFQTQTEYTICEGELVIIDLSDFPFGIQNGSGQIIENFETAIEGDYEFSANNSCGSVNQTVSINVNPFNPSPFSAFVKLCPARDTVTIGFENPDYNFAWNSGAITSTINVSAGGEYLVTVDNGGDCSDVFSFVVNEMEPEQRVIFEEPVISICEEGNRILTFPYYGYPYIFPDSSRGYSYKIEESGPVHVSYTDECFTYNASAEILVEPCLCPVYIPNAFSPDMNGINDVFKAYTSCPLVDFNMIIFNKWGDVVFESNDINTGWNGHSKNSSFYNSNDLYNYRIHYTQSLDGLHYPSELKGHVTVIR